MGASEEIAPMTKNERVRATIAGSPVDRVPFSFWYHFRHEPLFGDGFVRATLNFYHTYSPDVLKVTHNNPYADLMPTGKPLFEKPSDWANLTHLLPDSARSRLVRTLRQIVSHIPDSAPVVATVPSVFATAQMLSRGTVLTQFAAEPEPVRQGLRVIARELAGYADTILRDTGCAGIFLAVSRAATETPADDLQFLLALDCEILESAQSGWCNIVHLHGESVDFERMRPLTDRADVLSLCDLVDTSFSLATLRARTGKCLMGGVSHTRISGATMHMLRAEITDALLQTDGLGLIVAPGCTIPPETPSANLHLFKEILS